MPRLAMPDNDELTTEQTEVIAEVISGKRGKVPAPMIAWLRNPELARRAQKLGEFLRFDSSLEPALSELAILVCGRHWTSHYEWTAHKKLALQADLDPKTIADIAASKAVPHFRNSRERTVYTIAAKLLADGKLNRELYAKGLETLGEKGMVDLVAIVGYYCLVSLTLNAFEIGLPENVAPELL